MVYNSWLNIDEQSWIMVKQTSSQSNQSDALIEQSHKYTCIRTNPTYNTQVLADPLRAHACFLPASGCHLQVHCHAAALTRPRCKHFGLALGERLQTHGFCPRSFGSLGLISKLTNHRPPSHPASLSSLPQLHRRSIQHDASEQTLPRSAPLWPDVQWSDVHGHLPLAHPQSLDGRHPVQPILRESKPWLKYSLIWWRLCYVFSSGYVLWPISLPCRCSKWQSLSIAVSWGPTCKSSNGNIISVNQREHSTNDCKQQRVQQLQLYDIMWYTSF